MRSRAVRRRPTHRADRGECPPRRPKALRPGGGQPRSMPPRQTHQPPLWPREQTQRGAAPPQQRRRDQLEARGRHSLRPLPRSHRQHHPPLPCQRPPPRRPNARPRRKVLTSAAFRRSLRPRPRQACAPGAHPWCAAKGVGRPRPRRAPNPRERELRPASRGASRRTGHVECSGEAWLAWGPARGRSARAQRGLGRSAGLPRLLRRSWEVGIPSSPIADAAAGRGRYRRVEWASCPGRPRQAAQRCHGSHGSSRGSG